MLLYGVVSKYLKDLLADINFRCFICPTSYRSGKEREQVSALLLRQTSQLLTVTTSYND